MALALPGSSFTPTATDGAVASEANAASELLAQSGSAVTTLEFRTPNYSVRVFNEPGGVVRMNVFRRTQPTQLEQNGQPAVINAEVANFVAYDSFGSRNNRNVIFRALGSTNPRQAALEILDQNTGQVILSEFATQILQMDLPNIPGGGNLTPNTILYFETPVHSVRVFQDAGIRKMNVFNRLTAQTQVNGKVADLVNPPIAPYDNWVSYFAGESFNGIAGRWIARVNGRGEAILQFIGANNTTLISENRLSTVPLIVNIPPADLLPGVDPPAAAGNLDPWIAAVFGDQTTLDQLEQLYASVQAPPSCGGTSVAAPFFENARQGRFINAGSFNDRNCAEALVAYLRSRGYNSRLVYRDFRYR
jgi:hypothetical protein